VFYALHSTHIRDIIVYDNCESPYEASFLAISVQMTMCRWCIGQLWLSIFTTNYAGRNLKKAANQSNRRPRVFPSIRQLCHRGDVGMEVTVHMLFMMLRWYIITYRLESCRFHMPWTASRLADDSR